MGAAADGTVDSFATEAAAAPDGAGGVIVVGMPTAAGVCAAQSVDSFAMEAAAAPDGAGGVIAVGIYTAADVCGAEGVTTVGMQHGVCNSNIMHQAVAIVKRDDVDDISRQRSKIGGMTCRETVLTVLQ